MSDRMLYTAGQCKCVAANPKRRKCHNDEAGYKCQILNRQVPGTHVVVYDGEQQGLDTFCGRWSVICEAHATVCQARSLPKARSLMRSVEFCERCNALAARGGAS